MQSNFAAALAAVLAHEGGFSDHPRDPGGATNRGITYRVFQQHYPGGSVDDLRNITDAQVSAIYATDYWARCRCDELPTGVDYAVFDAAVNSGPAHSARWLQRAVGASIDGIIGGGTIAATSDADVDATIRAICHARLDFLKNLPTWPTFGRGWERRVDEVREEARSLAGLIPLEQSEPPRARTLRRGDQGEDVRELQRSLDIEADGVFGLSTERAVRAFQSAHRLGADGIVGPATHAALRADA